MKGKYRFTLIIAFLPVLMGCSGRLTPLSLKEPVQVKVEKVLNDGEKLYLFGRVRAAREVSPEKVIVTFRGTKGPVVIREKRNQLSSFQFDQKSDSYLVYSSLAVNNLDDYQFEGELLPASKGILFLVNELERSQDKCGEGKCEISYLLNGKIKSFLPVPVEGNFKLRIIYFPAALSDDTQSGDFQEVELGTINLDVQGERVIKLTASATVEESLKDFIKPQVQLVNESEREFNSNSNSVPPSNR